MTAAVGLLFRSPEKEAVLIQHIFLDRQNAVRFIFLPKCADDSLLDVLSR